jgi:flagellin
MGLRIQNNVEAFNAHRQLTQTSAKAAKAMERLSSGYRVNRASDDAAGLAISEKMRAQIGGLAQAQRNAQDAVSLVQTAEGALTEVHSMLQRIRDLKVQFENGTLDTPDKVAVASEVKELVIEINDIRENTAFNGIYLLRGDKNGDGTVGDSTVQFQVGAGDSDTVTASVSNLIDLGDDGVDNIAGNGDDTPSTTPGMLAVYDAVYSDVADYNQANDVVRSVGDGSVATDIVARFDALDMSDLDDAIEEVSTARSGFGAIQNRLDHRLNNLAAYQENLVASESRIRDVDMAQEMVNFSKLQILQQAGTAMLAQANQSSQGVLSLIR